MAIAFSSSVSERSAERARATACSASSCLVRIEPQRFLEHRQCPRVGLRLHAVHVRQRLQEEVVRLQVLRPLAPEPFDLGATDLRLDGADYAFRDPVLKVEDVLEVAVETFGPEVAAAERVDQLRGEADAIGRLAHAALQHVAHAEIAGDLPHVNRPVLVDEGRVAGDDEQPPEARQRGDDVLDHAVGEVLLVGVIRQVGERQHGNRSRRRSVVKRVVHQAAM
jgi:hypothetical protein